jgi:hypothetical protein
VAPVFAAGQCTASHEHAMSLQSCMEDESFILWHSNTIFNKYSEQVQITQLVSMEKLSAVPREHPQTVSA